MQIKKQQLELDMEQQTGSKLGKEYPQGYISSPCLFNFHVEYIMWNAGLDEAQAEVKIARRNTIASDTQMSRALWQKLKKN